tara:strand:- start:3573 stop:3737 length:165 start_codon:yes stop_codon:yes gene_type:complete
MDDNWVPHIMGNDFETTRLHEENKLLKLQVEELQKTINSLKVSFVQETGREIAV